MGDILFHEGGDLRDALDANINSMRSKIAEISPDRMNGATDNELVDHFVSAFQIPPLTIHTDKAIADHDETKINVWGDHLGRFAANGESPINVKGDEITLHIPFTGSSELLQLTPSTRNLNPPRGRVVDNDDESGVISETFALPSDKNSASEFNKWIEKQLHSLDEYAKWINSDLASYNNLLTKHALGAVLDRRKQLENQGELLKKLIVPLRARPDAPSPRPIPMPKKNIKPLPPARKVEQEYGINETDYEHILKIIRHESRSFESTPRTFNKLDEEELRDVVLAHLNGHFEGDAAGERFRNRGKTDICIEYKNRAAFIAECKLWNGPKACKDAINQLLNYLTWRDTKTALIFWNKKTKDFAKLQAGVPDILRSHDKYIRELNSGHVGEWRALFKSAIDEGRDIQVHVFVANLLIE